MKGGHNIIVLQKIKKIIVQKNRIRIYRIIGFAGCVGRLN
jgi:hypothetical protein